MDWPDNTNMKKIASKIDRGLDNASDGATLAGSAKKTLAEVDKVSCSDEYIQPRVTRRHSNVVDELSVAVDGRPQTKCGDNDQSLSSKRYPVVMWSSKSIMPTSKYNPKPCLVYQLTGSADLNKCYKFITPTFRRNNFLEPSATPTFTVICSGCKKYYSSLQRKSKTKKKEQMSPSPFARVRKTDGHSMFSDPCGGHLEGCAPFDYMETIEDMIQVPESIRDKYICDEHLRLFDPSPTAHDDSASVYIQWLYKKETQTASKKRKLPTSSEASSILPILKRNHLVAGAEGIDSHSGSLVPDTRVELDKDVDELQSPTETASIPEALSTSAVLNLFFENASSALAAERDAESGNAVENEPVHSDTVSDPYTVENRDRDANSSVLNGLFRYVKEELFDSSNLEKKSNIPPPPPLVFNQLSLPNKNPRPQVKTIVDSTNKGSPAGADERKIAKATHFKKTVPLTGMFCDEDYDVTVKGGQLQVLFEKKTTTRTYSSSLRYSYEFNLPENVDVDTVETSLEDGSLIINAKTRDNPSKNM